MLREAKGVVQSVYDVWIGRLFGFFLCLVSPGGKYYTRGISIWNSITLSVNCPFPNFVWLTGVLL